MSFKRNPETNLITSLKTRDVVFSYAFLISPRPDGNFGAGQYASELIISDELTKDEVTEYLKQAIEEGKSTIWQNKIPKDLHLPIKEGDDDNELEAGHLILKTSTKKQPAIWIRNSETGKAHEVEEDEFDDIYSGMIGEAIVKFRPYDYNGKRGIKAYLDAVCKTEAGTVLGSSISYEDEFSLASEFDDVMGDRKTLEEKAKKTGSKGKKDEANEDDSVDIDSLVKSKTGKKTNKVEQVEVNVGTMTLDDLLKK